MIKNITEIHWASFYNIWIFLFVGLVALLLFLRYKKQGKAYNFLVGINRDLLCNVSFKKQFIKCACITIAVIFLCLALMRPQWDKSEETIMQEGRDLYIALDISRSMLATDCKPNRLTFAKEKIKKLIKELSCDRVGLILFSGSAFVQCPLTSDYSAFSLYLDTVDAELISSGTTALDQAIQQALTSFASAPDRKNKLVVLFTDGEDFSHNLHNVKQEAIEAGLSLFSFGVGTPEGAPIPLFDMQGNLIGHQKDVHGGVVISRLNEEILRTLSEDVGGNYIHAMDGDSDIVSLIKAVNSFDKEQIAERKHSRYEDQYHYFLLVTFICLLFEWLL